MPTIDDCTPEVHQFVACSSLDNIFSTSVTVRFSIVHRRLSLYNNKISILLYNYHCYSSSLPWFDAERVVDVILARHQRCTILLWKLQNMSDYFSTLIKASTIIQSLYTIKHIVIRHRGHTSSRMIPNIDIKYTDITLETIYFHRKMHPLTLSVTESIVRSDHQQYDSPTIYRHY